MLFLESFAIMAGMTCVGIWLTYGKITMLNIMKVFFIVISIVLIFIDMIIRTPSH